MSNPRIDGEVVAQAIGHPLDPVALRQAGREVVTRALAEDMGDTGDLTTVATVPAGAVGHVDAVARRAGVFAGGWLLVEVYAQLADEVVVDVQVQDGEMVDAGEVVGEVRGPMRAILTGERTALNLLSHLSGVATATRAYVDALAGTATVVRDTRKTLPGLRLLEKEAVLAGGGVNHRIGLFDGLLVKDNHVEAAGSVAAATMAALAAAGGRPVQIEVDDLDQLDEAIAAGARDILLDNFDLATTRAAVARVRQIEADVGPILLESSGAITLRNVRAYAEAGVDRVAIGAITHSASQIDIGFDARQGGDGSVVEPPSAATGGT